MNFHEIFPWQIIYLYDYATLNASLQINHVPLKRYLSQWAFLNSCVWLLCDKRLIYLSDYVTTLLLYDGGMKKYRRHCAKSMQISR